MFSILLSLVAVGSSRSSSSSGSSGSSSDDDSYDNADATFSNVGFYHGIASGDATDSDVVIWTRITPPFQDVYAEDNYLEYNHTQLQELKNQYQTVSVHYAMSTSLDSLYFDHSNSAGSTYGVTQTSLDIDFTVKVIVDSLTSDTLYYYQFKVGDVTSDIGKTHTLPSPDAHVESFTFAVGACKRFGYGYFNNLGDIADRTDLRLMLWLGDYIYESPDTATANGTAIGRIPHPNEWLSTLEQYRSRYLQHRLDEDVQNAHRSLPWYLMWDDHEVVNDYWFDGAYEKYDVDNMTFMQRKVNGYQAFFEWTPIRNINWAANGGLHRKHSIGDLFDLLIVDARSQRTDYAPNKDVAQNMSADVLYAFGETQREWIINQLKDSQLADTKWRVFGTNAAFGDPPAKELFDGHDFFGNDHLDSFPAERQIILDSIRKFNIDNIVSLAGGPHTGIAHNVFSKGSPSTGGSYPLFAEFVMDAIASPKKKEAEYYLPYLDDIDPEYFRLIVDGFAVVNVNTERIKTEFWINDNIKIANTTSVLDATYCVYDNNVEPVLCDEYSSSDDSDDDSGSDDESGSAEAVLLIKNDVDDKFLNHDHNYNVTIDVNKFTMLNVSFMMIILCIVNGLWLYRCLRSTQPQSTNKHE
eukprot:324198_1